MIEFFEAYPGYKVMCQYIDTIKTEFMRYFKSGDGPYWDTAHSTEKDCFRWNKGISVTYKNWTIA